MAVKFGFEAHGVDFWASEVDFYPLGFSFRSLWVNLGLCESIKINIQRLKFYSRRLKKLTSRDPKSPITGPRIEQIFTHSGPESTPRHKMKSQRPKTQKSKIDFQMPNVGSHRLKIESNSLKSYS